MWRVWIASLLMLPAGCGARSDGELLKSGGGQQSMTLSAGGSLPSKADPNAAPHAIPVVISLQVYHLTAPFGAISGNDEFWKRIDEDRIDVATRDLLLKNGLRVGIGRNVDWPYYKGLMGKYPSSRSIPIHTEVGKEGNIELPMRTNIPEQNIFGLDDKNVDWGRTFEKCDDLLGISFVASTHNPGLTIVKVCPIVHSLKREFHVSVMNNEEVQIDFNQPSYLYDMRLEAMVPLNDFLIVAPSRRAAVSTSLGGTFLVTEGKTEPIEHVLVIVPSAFRIDDPATGDGK